MTTATQTPPTTAPGAVAIQCVRCGALLGYSLERIFRLPNGLVILTSVKMMCACGEWRRWTPVRH